LNIVGIDFDVGLDLAASREVSIELAVCTLVVRARSNSFTAVATSTSLVAFRTRSRNDGISVGVSIRTIIDIRSLFAILAEASRADVESAIARAVDIVSFGISITSSGVITRRRVVVGASIREENTLASSEFRVTFAVFLSGASIANIVASSWGSALFEFRTENALVRSLAFNGIRSQDAEALANGAVSSAELRGNDFTRFADGVTVPCN
jgi:hypothetical protein